MTGDLSQPLNMPALGEVDVDFDIVDSHHHLFDLQAVYYPWLTDKPEPHFLLGDYDRLKTDYGVADYRADAAGLRVVKTVHVEAESDRADPVAETRYLADVMSGEGLPDALVAHAWLHEKDSESVIAEQAAFEAVRSIRSKPVTSVSATARNEVRGRPASMQDPDWRRGLGLLSKYGLSWDLRVPYWHLREAAEVCALYPDLSVVVEHTGLPWDRTEEGLAEWRAGMELLAAQDRICLKISELGLAASAWDYADNRRVVREAIGLFGFGRCMFASNFPVAGLRVSFNDQVRAIAHMVADCSAAERQDLFHDTAVRFYRL